MENQKSLKLNSRFLIKTPTGYEKFHGIQKKIKNKLYTINFVDGTHIKVSNDHAFLTNKGFITAENLNLDLDLSGKKIKSINFIEGIFEVYDPVEVDKHNTYFSADVVSHNTEFLGSSNTLISGDKLQKLIYNDPIDTKGQLKIYEHPVKSDNENIKDHLYAITVDVAEGRNLDASAFSVIDVSTIPYKQVAVYRSTSISPILFPTEIYNVAKYYNEAYILVELNNNPQVAETLATDLEYENIIRVSSGNKKSQTAVFGHSTDSVLGLKTSATTKRIGCTNLKTLIESDKLLLNDFDTISELTTFVADNTTFRADGDATDDLVMTLVIFGWLSNQKMFKDIVNHDIRKQLQLENMSQLDDELLPVISPVNENINTDDNEFWVEAKSFEEYDNFMKKYFHDF